MRILAIETAGAGGSVALQADGNLLERNVTETREQTARLLPMIDELLRDAGLAIADLHAVAFGRGPGSFTGLRVAAAVAQGLALSTGVTLVPVSSMAGLLQQAARRNDVNAALVCIDARMDEVYWGRYALEAGVARPVGAEAIAVPQAIPVPDGDEFACIGDGFARYPEALAAVLAGAGMCLPDMQPLARDLLPIAAADLARGERVEPHDALPVYLRDSTAWQRR